MEHKEHVELLRGGVSPGGIWAELGSGGGAFTLALADLLGPESTIYSVDRDGQALQRQAASMRASFPDMPVTCIEADYTRRLDLPPLDGLLLANALHFQRRGQQRDVLGLAHDYLKPGGRLLIVEYNIDRGNLWVPHPFSYETWAGMAAANGFSDTRRLAVRPSRHLREIYSAISFKKGGQP